jgi:regulator of RNase E activity RraA
VFARGNTMRTGKDRVTADAYNVPVQVAGVRVEPGDWLMGDADGVIAIPASRCEEVVAIAEDIEAVEQQIRDKVSSGMRLDEARKSLGYHALQTKR